jgi:hypothetical protein
MFLRLNAGQMPRAPSSHSLPTRIVTRSSHSIGKARKVARPSDIRPLLHGQIVDYSRGMRPSLDYIANRRPRLTRRQFRGTVIRTVGYIAAALVCSAFVLHIDHAWSFAIRVGLVTGIVTGIGVTVNPYVEYYADNLPERRLGAFGIGLILCGFALHSLQYWLALFDVRLT